MDQQSLSTPFKCPLSSCSEIISSSTVLSHFLSHQRDEESVDFQEIHKDEHISLMVTVQDNYLVMNKNICLGLLAYSTDKSTHSNVMLAQIYEEFDHHIPILIMACRSNYVTIFESEPDFIDPEADFLIIWLLMPEISDKKLIVTLTAYNEDHTKSLSTLISVRSINDSQNIREFMENSSDFLVINSGFLKKLSQESNSIFIEVSITENSL